MAEGIKKIVAILPHGAVYGGVKRYIESGNEFIKMGIDFAIATVHPADWQWCPFKGRSFTIDAMPDESWDVVILTNPAIAEHVKKFRTKIMAVNVINGIYARDSYRKVIDNYHPDVIIGCSMSVKEIIPECEVVAGGIDPAVFYPKTDFSLHDPMRILSYGRQRNPRKRVGDTLEIFRILRQKAQIQLELHLFDSKSFIQGDGIVFHSNLFGSKLADLFRSCDIFISPEEQAGWHNTAAEAMACGLPVICTEDGTRDFALQGESALIMKTGDIEGFVNGAIRIISESTLRLRLIQAGIEKIREFSWKSYSAALLKVFQRAIDSKNNPGENYA